MLPQHRRQSGGTRGGGPAWGWSCTGCVSPQEPWCAAGLRGWPWGWKGCSAPKRGCDAWGRSLCWHRAQRGCCLALLHPCLLGKGCTGRSCNTGLSPTPGQGDRGQGGGSGTGSGTGTGLSQGESTATENHHQSQDHTAGSQTQPMECPEPTQSHDPPHHGSSQQGLMLPKAPPELCTRAHTSALLVCAELYRARRAPA